MATAKPIQEKLDASQCEKMAQLVEKLTTTGRSTLDQEQMKAFKKICKQSDEYVKHAFHLLSTQLEKNHSEIRLSCFLMVDELFQRSHCFREQLLADFQYFLMLVAETETDVPLPPPKSAAKTLKAKSLETIQIWHEKFSETYKKLALGYNYLQHCKKVDFNDIRARNIAERRREEEQKRKEEQQRKERIDIVVKELTEGKLEIENVITQLENCLQLLLPDPETFNFHGLASPEYKPNYNPFRIGSRRRSSTQPTISKAPVYGPVQTDTVQKSEFSSKLSKGGRRKSSSTIETPSSVGTQCVSKGRRSSASNSQMSSPEHLQEVKSAKNFVLETDKGHNCTTVSKRKRCVSSSNQNKQNEKLDDPGVNSVDLSCNRGCRISCQKPDSENFTYESLTSVTTNDGDGHLQSDDESDAEDNMEEMSDDEDDYVPHTQFVRESGLGSQHYSINIDLNPDHDVEVTETQDNTDILYNMRDLTRELVNKWSPAVAKWLKVLTKNGADKSIILKAIDMKRHITKVKEKVGEVRVVKSTKQTLGKASVSIESREDSDSDFEDVPEKEGFEPRIPNHLREEYGLVSKGPKPSTSKDWKLEETTAEYNDVSDPTSWQATIKRIEQKIYTENNSPAAKDLTQNTEVANSPRPKKKLKDPNVPSVPFGTDLLHWGEEKVEMPLLVRYESDLKGWVPKGDEMDVVDVNALESMRSRIINFQGEFEPVKWKCRAPMPTGKLCERMDRIKCPFHGKIIARDEQGNPTDPTDIARLAEKKVEGSKEGNVDWEDPELQADIQTQTGIQLVRQKKGKGKGKPQKYPGLTDLRKTRDSCRRRLQNKVLSSQAIRRVASKLDNIHTKQIKDKFGNNFHYSLPQ